MVKWFKVFDQNFIGFGQYLKGYSEIREVLTKIKISKGLVKFLLFCQDLKGFGKGLKGFGQNLEDFTKILG